MGLLTAEQDFYTRRIEPTLRLLVGQIKRDNRMFQRKIDGTPNTAPPASVEEYSTAIETCAKSVFEHLINILIKIDKNYPDQTHPFCKDCYHVLKGIEAYFAENVGLLTRTSPITATEALITLWDQLKKCTETERKQAFNALNTPDSTISGPAKDLYDALQTFRLGEYFKANSITIQSGLSLPKDDQYIPGVYSMITAMLYFIDELDDSLAYNTFTPGYSTWLYNNPKNSFFSINPLKKIYDHGIALRDQLCGKTIEIFKNTIWNFKENLKRIGTPSSESSAFEVEKKADKQPPLNPQKLQAATQLASAVMQADAAYFDLSISANKGRMHWLYHGTDGRKRALDLAALAHAFTKLQDKTEDNVQEFIQAIIDHLNGKNYNQMFRKTRLREHSFDTFLLDALSKLTHDSTQETNSAKKTDSIIPVMDDYERTKNKPPTTQKGLILKSIDISTHDSREQSKADLIATLETLKISSPEKPSKVENSPLKITAENRNSLDLTSLRYLTL